MTMAIENETAPPSRLEVLDNYRNSQEPQVMSPQEISQIDVTVKQVLAIITKIELSTDGEIE